MKPQLIEEIENSLKELDMEQRSYLIYYLVGYCEGDLELGNAHERKHTEKLMKVLLKRIKEDLS
jgi:hypothetical protein